MSTINYKNQLQEYTQKHKLNMPKYNHKQVGINFDIQWISTLEFNDKLYISIAHNKKTDADIDCAKQAINEILKQKSPLQTFDIKNAEYILWIDLDNCMDIYNKLINNNYIDHEKYHLRGFCCVNFDISQMNIPINATISKANIHKKDMADTMLSYDFFKYIINQYDPNIQYLIISKDATLENIPYIIIDDYPDINIRYLTTMQDVLLSIKK